MSERLDRFWVGVAVSLLFFSIAGAIVFLSLRPSHQTPLLISPPVPVVTAGDIYVGGAVVNPGLYPLKPGDTVTGLLADAGGPSAGADQRRLSLVLPATNQTSQYQKVDLNRAEPWLLEALPGVGPATAAAIVGYRDQHGPFRMVKDLLDVPGIGDATLQHFRDYVTVGE
jgi:competence protein ComEA